jgi:hypothetical protein
VRRERVRGGGSEGHYRVGGEGVIETKFCSFEGSQAVPASLRICSVLNFKDVGAAVVGRKEITYVPVKRHGPHGKQRVEQLYHCALTCLTTNVSQ